MQHLFRKTRRAFELSGQYSTLVSFFCILFAAVILYGCGTSSGSPMMMQPTQSLPVISINTLPVTTYREFTASVEGTKNIDIRPQVEGYLEKIYVDEGAHVKK